MKRVFCNHPVNQWLNRSIPSSCKSANSLCQPSVKTDLCTGRQDAVRIRWPAWTSSFSRNPRAPKWWRGKAGGPRVCVCEKGQVSLTDHYSLRPQLLTAGSSHLDSFLLWQGGSQVLSTRGPHSQWAPGMCRSGSEGRLGGVDLGNDGTTRYIFSRGMLEHVISSTSVFHF